MFSLLVTTVALALFVQAFQLTGVEAAARRAKMERKEAAAAMEAKGHTAAKSDPKGGEAVAAQQPAKAREAFPVAQ